MISTVIVSGIPSPVFVIWKLLADNPLRISVPALQAAVLPHNAKFIAVALSPFAVLVKVLDEIYRTAVRVALDKVE